jgi:adenylylsulfate kinase-like enzyme
LQILDRNIGFFKEKRQFFAKNWRKFAEIAKLLLFVTKFALVLSVYI